MLTFDLYKEKHLPATLGFRSGDRGTHTSRTMMLAELTAVMAYVPPNAASEAYRQAIIEDNVTGKRTLSTRKLTAQRLSELYALDPVVPVFRLLRFFWEIDQESQPLLALLCACARDPLLRATAPAVLEAPLGASVEKEAIEQAVGDAAPGRFNASILNKIARNARSSWTQSGHLQGHSHKTRSKPVCTPATVAYALLLGYFSGYGGQRLFDTFWTRLLDTDTATLHELAQEASRRSWLTYRNAGGIIEVDFSVILKESEREVLREQD